MKIKVNVLTKHIKDGVLSSSRSCPVALALRDKGYTHVLVTLTHTFVIKGENQYDAVLPLKTNNFIKNFDNKLKVKPMSFELKLVKRK